MHGNPDNIHIWLFWNHSLHLSLLQVSDQAITVSVTFRANDESIICSFIYAKLNAPKLREDPDSLIHLSHSSRRSPAMHEFHDFAIQAGLSDAGYEGLWSMRCNNHQGTSRIWQRLDRVLVNGTFMSALPTLKLSHLARHIEDHCPLLLSIIQGSNTPSLRSPQNVD